MEKLVLIDGNSLFNRAFYATPVFSTRSGMHTNAIFGFVKLLLKIIKDNNPEYILVAFDMKAPTFRHKMSADYKSTRKPMPDELAVQVEPLKQLIAAMGIATCQCEGIEADDIIGTLSNKFDVHSYIYTGDRDSYQLVDNKTDVFFTKKGVSDLLRLNIDNFEMETGLNPPQIVDLKALMGDKSDNISGVPGIGEKTAVSLLNKYGTLDGIYAHLDELTAAMRTKFESNKDKAYLSYTLAKIDRSCDLDVKLADCACPQKFGAEVKKMFAEFEFNSLLGLDIFDSSEGGESVEIVYPEKIVCRTLDDAGKLTESNKLFCIALGETNAEIYAGNKQYSLTVANDLLSSDKLDSNGFMEILREIYENPSNKVIAFDYKEQVHRLEALDITPVCGFEDLSLLVYVCDGGTVAQSLKELCEQNLYDYGYSAFALHGLYEKYSKKLRDENQTKLYYDVEKPLIPVLYEMEKTGVAVSTPILDELYAYYDRLTEESKKKVFDACGCEFNINSPMQLGEVLHVTLGIAEVKKKKTGKYTTSAEVLESLADKYPVVSDVLRYRQYQKLKSTYIEGFRPLIDKKGVVHTTYKQNVTATGRLSSVNPNLQNIPIRNNEGRELRKVFVPRAGNYFIDADYSQIELRLLAHFSGCKELVDGYKKGIDIHSVTASQVFGVPMESVTPQMRRMAKAVNFGIIYGISEFGLAKNIGVSVAEAKAYIDKYFETYSDVKKYMDENVAFAKEHGYITTLFGRKRKINEINSSNYALRQYGERAAMNMPLQGTSSDIIKIAMINVNNALKENRLKSRLILQVHDELVVEAPESEVEIASRLLKENMENAVELKVPLTVEVSCGKNWYDAK